MGDFLNLLDSAQAWLERLITAAWAEEPMALAVAAALILLAVAAALLRLAALSTASAILAVLFPVLQAMDGATQWRVLGFASIAALLVLMVILRERRELVRQLRDDRLDLDARFDSFLTALDRRHALSGGHGAPQGDILTPPSIQAVPPVSPGPIN